MEPGGIDDQSKSVRFDSHSWVHVSGLQVAVGGREAVAESPEGEDSVLGTPSGPAEATNGTNSRSDEVSENSVVSVDDRWVVGESESLDNKLIEAEE